MVAVSQKGEVEIEFAGELVHRLNLVRGDADHPGSGRLVLAAAIAHAASLRRAARRVGAGIEVENDGLPLQIGEADLLTRLIGQGEVGCGDASLEHLLVGILAARVLTALVLVELVVALLQSRLGNRTGGARVVAGLEALEGAVAPVLIDRDLVGDPHPLGALVGLHVEDLLVERGRVVDDDQDLGLRVEVGPGLHQQLLDLVEVLLGGSGHQLPNPMKSATCRSTSTSTSSGSSPRRMRRSLRAITNSRTSARSFSSRLRLPFLPLSSVSSRAAISASTSSGSSPRCKRR